MAVYNGEKFIEEQLVSILKQTKQVDEVIISDDGSKDKTVELIENFIDTHKLNSWYVVKNTGSHGFIGNFFHAIGKTTGDILLLCDQDDIWIENRVERISQFMKKHAEIIALNTAVVLVDDKGEPLNIKRKRGYCNGNILHEPCLEGELRAFSFEYLTKTNISPGCTMAFRSSIKEQVLSFEKSCVDNQFPHDWFINVFASLKQGTYFWNEELTKYRMHDNNTIGVDTSEEASTSQIRSSREQRRAIGEFHLQRALLLKKEMHLDDEQSKNLDEYIAFVKARYTFLQNYSFVKLLGVYRHLEMYIQTIGARSMLSDFIYAMKLDQVFRR